LIFIAPFSWTSLSKVVWFVPDLMAVMSDAYVPLTLFVLFVALPIVADISGEISQGVAPLFTPSKVLFAAWLYD
jgi:hypothetical protein